MQLDPQGGAQGIGTLGPHEFRKLRLELFAEDVERLEDVPDLFVRKNFARKGGHLASVSEEATVPDFFDCNETLLQFRVIYMLIQEARREDRRAI